MHALNLCNLFPFFRPPESIFLLGLGFALSLKSLDLRRVFPLRCRALRTINQFFEIVVGLFEDEFVLLTGKQLSPRGGRHELLYLDQGMPLVHNESFWVCFKLFISRVLLSVIHFVPVSMVFEICIADPVLLDVVVYYTQ